MDAFGELRSLLQQPPSAPLYEQLCAHMERIKPDDALERCLPYARAHMDRTWPTELRAWSKTWTRRFIKGQALPVTGLATSCDLSNRHLGLDHLDALRTHDYIRDLELLDLSRNEGLGPYLEQLVQLPLFYGIKRLNIHTTLHQIKPGSFKDLLDHPSLFALEELNCIAPSDQRPLSELAQSGASSRMKHLRCTSGGAQADLIALLKAPMPALETLHIYLLEGPSVSLGEAMSSSSWWPQLTALHLLGETQLETIKLIWPIRPRQLKRLTIKEPMTPVSPKGLLTTLPGLEDLDELITWPWLDAELNAALLARLNPTASARLLAYWREHHAYAQRLFEVGGS